MSQQETIQKIESQIHNNPIVLYMKGSPNFPSCGFSSRVAEIMIEIDVDFAFVDILQNPDIRAVLPIYASWPTYPQLWVNGELIGGCDIITEMHQKGELKPLLETAVSKK